MKFAALTVLRTKYEQVRFDLPRLEQELLRSQNHLSLLKKAVLWTDFVCRDCPLLCY